MDFSQPGVPAVGATVNCRTEVTSLSYHEDGKRLFVACEGDSRLHIIDCIEGKSERLPLRVEREQIHLIEATHHESCILFSGKGTPTQAIGIRNAINYWSIHDNKILRKFRGHTDKVQAISMCPANDTFLSSSDDRTVRLWAANSAGCIGQLKLPTDTVGSPNAVFDSTGLVFAISAEMTEQKGHYVHLYDARNYSGGAFAELKVPQADLEAAIASQTSTAPDMAKTLSLASWNDVNFNVSGNQILVGADKGLSVLLDGFEGTIQRVALASTIDRPAVSCFTPDDRTVLIGNSDGSITCWDAASGAVTQKLEGHKGPISCLKANPKYAQFASSCTNTALWCW